MPKSSVPFPELLFASLDRIARERGVSRNRVIVESCRRTVEKRCRWPDDFFSNSHLSADELTVLREGCEDFERAIRSARQSRTARPF